MAELADVNVKVLLCVAWHRIEQLVFNLALKLALFLLSAELLFLFCAALDLLLRRWWCISL